MNKKIKIIINLFSKTVVFLAVGFLFLMGAETTHAQVVYDTSTTSHTSGNASTSEGSFGWSHTGGASPEGVVVFVYTAISATPYDTAVTYGVESMTLVSGGTATATGLEAGVVRTYFLGSSVPTGSQTVTVTRTNNSTEMWAVAFTVDAAADTEVYTAGIVLLQSSSLQASEQNVDDESPGANSVRFAGLYSGHKDVPLAGTYSTKTFDNDLGNYTAAAAYETTAGQGSRPVGLTMATADEAAGVHLAVREAVPTYTLSGTFYDTGESTAYDCGTGGPYDVRLRVDGAGTYATTCTDIGGSWEVTDVSVGSGDTVYVYIYNETPKGSTVYVSDGTTTTDIPIYQNRVTLRDDANGSITAAEILTGNTADADDLITTSGTDVSVAASYETHIYTSDTFAPGDNVSTGFLHIDTSAVYSGGSDTLTLTGTSGTLIDRDGTFTQGTSTVSVTSASGTPTLLTAATTFHILTINASATVINDGAAITINNAASAALTVTSGVLNLSANPTGPGGTNGTLTVASGATLCLGGGTSNTSATCDSVNSATAAVSMPTFQTYTLNSAGTVRFLSDAAVTVSNTPSYGNLIFNPRFDTTSRTYTLGGAMTINGNFTIDPSESGASTPALTVNSAGTITVPAGKTTTIQASDSATSSLDIHPGTSYDLSTGLLNVGAGGTLDGTTATSTITLTGTAGTLFTLTGTFNAGSSTVTVSNASGTPSLNSGAITFNNLTSGSSANFNIASSINIGDNLTNTGAVGYTGTPTVTMTGGSSNIGSGTGAVTLYNLTSDTGASVSIDYSISVAGDITNTGAITYSGTPTVTMTGNPKILGGGAGSITLYNLTSDTGASININSSISVAGNFQNTTDGIIGTSAGTPTVTMTGSSKNLGGGTTGTITLHHLATSGTASITFTGGATNTFNGNISVGSGTTLNINDDISVAGNFQNTTDGIIGTSAGTPTVTFTGSATIGGGTTGAVTFHHLATLGTGIHNFSNGGTNTFNGNITVGTGTTLNLNSSASITGNLTNTTTGIIGYSGTPTITMTGIGGNTIGGGAGAISFYNLTIDPTSAATITLNSDATVNNTLEVAVLDTLSIASGKILTHEGVATPTLTLPDTAIISGLGTLYYTSSSSFPSTGSFSAGIRIDGTGGNRNITDRGVNGYGGNVEIYSNSGTAREFVLGNGALETIDIVGNLTLTAAGANTVSLTATLHDPTVVIDGNISYTAGGSAESITTSDNTGNWTVGGNVNFTNGTFTATTGNTFIMTGSSKTVTSNGQSFYNFKVSGTGAVSSADAMIVNGTFTLADTATFTHGDSVNLTIYDDVTFAAGTTFNNSTGGIVILDGDLTYDDNTGSITPPTPPAETLQNLGDVQIGASPATTNLISDFSANSLTVSVGDNFNTCEYEVDIANSDITINGTMDTGPTGQGVSPCSGGNEGDETWIYLASTFTISGTGSFEQDQSTLVMDNPSGTDTIRLDGESLYNLTVSPAGTTQFLTGYAVDIDNNLTITTGTLDMNGQTVNIGGNFDNDANLTHANSSVTFDATTGTKTIDADGTTDALYDVTFNDSVGDATWQLTTLMDVDHDFTITDGIVDVNGSWNINVGNNWSINSNGAFTASSGTVIMDAQDAGNTLTGTMTGSSSFNNLTFDDSVSSGAWTFAANPATVTGNFIITGGTVTAPSTTLTIGANFTNSDGFTHNSGTVTFNTAGDSTLTYLATTIFNNLTISTASKQVYFEDTNAVVTDVDGLLTIQGSDCTSGRVLLDGIGGLEWEIDVSGGSTNIDYTDIEDSTANTATIYAENSTEDNLGNTNWNITGGACGAIEVRIKGNTRGFSGVRIK